MTADTDIVREETDGRGRYLLRIDGALAELTYSRAARDKIVATHTGVPPAMRNRGIALRLVERLVADARAEGLRIVPACSYVALQRRRHPDWADLFVEA